MKIGVQGMRRTLKEALDVVPIRKSNDMVPVPRHVVQFVERLLGPFERWDEAAEAERQKLNVPASYAMAAEAHARAAYEQFCAEPHPEGFAETYPSWADLDEDSRFLWHNVAASVLNTLPKASR